MKLFYITLPAVCFMGCSGDKETDTSDTVEPPENTAPTADILTPLSVGNYYADQPIQFSAVVGDAEDTNDALSISWSSSLDGELSIETTPNTAGEIAGEGFLSEGQHTLELTVTDTQGAIETAAVDLTVSGDNVIPSCSITEPLDNATAIVGESVAFRAEVDDADIPNNELQVEWSSNHDGVFDTGSPTSGGSVTMAYSDLSPNVHTITLTVSDEVGAICSEQILLSVGAPPTASIDQPTDGEVYALGEAIAFSGVLGDPDDALNSLLVAWSSDVDGELNTGAADTDGLTQFTSADLSVGSHVITLSATDAMGFAAEDAISIVVNTPPAVDSITLSPSPLYSTDTLSTTISLSDAEGQAVTASYAWYENGVLTSFTGDAIADSELDVGEEWTVRITPNDGIHDGTPVEESITVSNALPVVSNVAISPNSGVTNDSVLTCSASVSDADEALSATFEWSLNGNTYSGATLDLSSANAMPTDTIGCTATVEDSQGASDSMSATVSVENRAPTLGSVLITPNSGLTTNSSLSCTSSAVDADGESPSIAYDWQVGGQSIGTGAILALNNGLVSPNDSLSCVASATDSYGGSDTATASVSIDNSNPSIDSMSLSPSDPQADGTLTCEANASDIDGDTPTLSFVFENLSSGESHSPSASPSPTTAELDLSGGSFGVGDTVACQATATDADGGTASSSATSTVSNTAPIVDSIAISPNTGVQTGTTLTCSANASDLNDGDISAAIAYSWTVNGNTVSSDAQYTVSAVETDVGDALTCTAMVSDANGASADNTASVTIENSPPTVSNVQIGGSSTYYNDETLNCSAAVDDIDDTPVTTYLWSSDGVDLGHADTFGLATAALLPDDTLSCTVTATDAQGASATNSTSVTIGNRAPSVPSVSISWTAGGASPVDTDDLNCSASGSVDLDGTSPYYSYSWTSDAGAFIAGPVVSSSQLTAGETWICQAIASDGTLSASGVNSVLVGSSVSWDYCPGAQSIMDAQTQLYGEAQGDLAGKTLTIVGDVDGDGLDDILIGVDENDEAASNAGKAYLVLGSTLASTNSLSLADADHVFFGESSDDYIGKDVSGAGDVDGDGLADFLIGAPSAANHYGRAYLILGASLNSPSISLADADVVFTGAQQWDGTGYSVSSAGDVDGDGLDDILIGSYAPSAGGKAHVYLGANLNYNNAMSIYAADYSFQTLFSMAFLGSALSGAGDIDGDGLGDLLIGAKGSDDYTGRVYVVLGASLSTMQSTFIESEADFTFIGNAPYDSTGRAVSGVGDVDGDGLDDILFSSNAANGSVVAAGANHLFLGSSLGSNAVLSVNDADYTYYGENASDQAGDTLSGVGDVNGDGLDDFIIGAHDNDDYAPSGGKAYLFFGGTLGPAGIYSVADADHVFYSDITGDAVGRGLGGGGDINNDGYDDILVSAVYSSFAGPNFGLIGIFSVCE